eukprot:Seg5648.1 transcript_id=Seg5648.1/GoldUCD/mRNA.D3Y31 product="hypothetical protein" protein_id=Seg5648.1/GoldUCD/D3Y31
MLRLLFTATFCMASFILLSECRMGWKNNGSEYLVYTANTNKAKSFNITGIFSITPGKLSKNQIIVGKDHNINAVNRQWYLFEIYANNWGQVNTIVPVPGGAQSGGFTVLNIGSGIAIDFTLTITQSESNGAYNHSVKFEIRGYANSTVNTKDNVKWDFDKMELFFGGYANPNATSMSPDDFHGCFSNVMFQGVDIIATYFSQYPNNTNPVRGSRFGSPPYATAMQNCSDVTIVTSTLGPISSTAKITSTRKPGAAASSRASLCILVAAVFLALLSF